MLHGDQMLASDWSRGKGRFLTPVAMYKDAQVVNRMHIYTRNLDPSFFWSKNAIKKKIPDPPPLTPHLQHSVGGGGEK